MKDSSLRLDPGSTSEIGRRAVSGAIWKVGAGLVNQVLRFVVLILLARLLGPTDFGLAALVMTFAAFGPVFADFSLGNALVFKERVTEREIDTVFWACVGIGIFFTSLGMALAHPLASFFGEPRLALMFVVFSASFLLMSLAAVPVSILTRAMRFQQLQVAAVVAAFLGAVAAVIAALLDLGPWALLIQYLVQTAAGAALLWRLCGWLPRLRFSMHDLRGIIGYSASVFGAHLLLQITPVGQNVLVGRLLGAPALGTLVITQNITTLPANRISAPIQDVLFPALARLAGDRERIVLAWKRSAEIVVLATVPFLLGLIVLAEEFVSVVLGPKWAGAETVIRILAVGGIMMSLQPLTWSLLQASGAGGRLLRVAAATAASTVIAVIAGVPFGLVGVATALAIQASLVQVAAFSYAGAVMKMRAVETVRPLAGALAASLFGVGVILATELLLQGIGLEALPRLVASSLVGGVAVALGVWIFARDLGREILRRVPVSRRFVQRAVNP